MQKRYLLWAVAACFLVPWSAGCGSESEGGGEPLANIGGKTTEEGSSENGGRTSSGGVKKSPVAQPPIDTLHPKVRFHTTAGQFVVELDAENAPLTVDNFLTYVDSGHYQNTIFHQASAGYLILGGGYTPDMKEKETRTAIRNEAHNGVSNVSGTIAMARAPDVIDSSTSQFFINLADNSDLLDHKDRTPADYGYCVFGKVVEGMDVVEKIGKTEVEERSDLDLYDVPVEPVIIERIEQLD